MTLAAAGVAPAGVAAGAAAPVQYVVPRVHGDPAAARRLAAAYRSLADELQTAAHVAAGALDDVSSWRGAGQHGSAHPVEVMTHNARLTTRALGDAADALDVYAHKLETAHSHHFFSLHKLLAVAAVVTATAAAVVVTMGAAAAAEAAIAAGAAGEATAAAGAAAAAGSGAAAGLAESTATLVGVRALLAFVVPHLVQAELSAGFTAGMEEAVDGHLDERELMTAAAAGFAGSAGSTAAARVVQSVKFAKEVWPFLAPVLPHLAQGATWGAVDAGQQAASGHLSLRELLLTAGLAGAASAGSSFLRRDPALTAHAYHVRQTAGELLNGVDLTRHEGDGLGHTLSRHVNVTDADLAHRIAAEGRRAASRFTDEATAHAAIATAFEAHATEVQKFFAGGAPRLRIRMSLDHVIGVVRGADGSTTLASQIVVWLARDGAGPFISSAYPELPR